MPAKRPALALLAGLVTALAAMPATSADLTLVTGQDYAPFAGNDLPDGGLATAVVQRAFEDQGYETEVKFSSWRRAYAQTLAAEADATFPYVAKPERRQEMRYSAPIFHVRAEVISSAERPVTYDGTLDSLAGLSVCIPEGFAPQTQIETLLDEDRLTRVDTRNIDKCPELIKLGRADFFAVNNFVWPSALHDAGAERSNFHIADTSLEENKLHLIVSRQHPEGEALIADFNAGLAALRESGDLAAMQRQYLQRGT